MFNVILVKFGFRPSTMIHDDIFADILLESIEFQNFINQDSDLKQIDLDIGTGPELYIYHKKYQDMFDSNNSKCETAATLIADKGHYAFYLDDGDNGNIINKIHRIRGTLLGYLRPNSFRLPGGVRVCMHLGVEVLTAKTNANMQQGELEWYGVYCYKCEPTKTNLEDAIRLWLSFKTVATTLGYKLSLEFE